MLLKIISYVSERSCITYNASHKTKAFGKLSVLAQWKSKVKKKFDLEPGSFTPPSKVKSTVVEFVPFKKVSENIDFQIFSNF